MVLLRRLQNYCGCAGTGAAERSAVSLCCFPVRGFPTLPRTFERTTRMMVGSLIQDQLMKAHNWPFAAALSVVLMILTSLMISLYKRVTHTTELEGIL